MVRQPPSVTTAEGQPDGTTARPAMLLVVGGGTFATHALTGDEVVIGRSSECQVHVDHPSLSRRHAVLRPGPPPVIEDLGSTNGTRIAGVTHRRGIAELRSNDVFHIGPFAFALVSAAGSATIVPTVEPVLEGLDADHRAERARILQILEACAGNQTRAARLLGIPRTTLANRLTVLRIPRPRR